VTAMSGTTAENLPVLVDQASKDDIHHFITMNIFFIRILA
jgi:hypothetical protein